MQRYLSAKKRQLILGLLLGIGLSVGAVMSALKLSNYVRTSEKASAAVLAEPTLPKNDPQTLPPVPPVPKQNFSSNPFGADLPPAKGMAAKSNLSKQLAAAHIYVHPPLPANPKTPKPSAQTQAQSHAGGVPSPANGNPFKNNPVKNSPDKNTPLKNSLAKKSLTPEQLWAQVQGGSTNAAVSLAELYIAGQAVPQNCQQARVLLLTASEKRNAAAIKRLQELDKDKSTCP